MILLKSFETLFPKKIIIFWLRGTLPINGEFVLLNGNFKVQNITNLNGYTGTLFRLYVYIFFQMLQLRSNIPNNHKRGSSVDSNILTNYICQVDAPGILSKREWFFLTNHHQRLGPFHRVLLFDCSAGTTITGTNSSTNIWTTVIFKTETTNIWKPTFTSKQVGTGEHVTPGPRHGASSHKWISKGLTKI